MGITLLAIALTTLLVYKGAHRIFRLNLRWRPLLLCAVCALFISMILPRIVISVTGLAGTVGVSALFAFLGALFVMRYDEQATAAVPATEDGDCFAAAAVSDGRGHEIMNVAPGEKVPLLSSTVDQGAVDASEQTGDWPEDAALYAGDIAGEPVAAIIASGAKQAVEPVPPRETFDDLLDYAFNRLENGCSGAALTAFRRALQLEPAHEAAPFVVVQIGNLLKNSGAYDEAVQVFSQGRNLPALQADPRLREEFIQTVAFLRITQNTLLQHHLGFLPFDKIPAAVQDEIRAEFQEWCKLV